MRSSLAMGLFGFGLIFLGFGVSVTLIDADGHSQRLGPDELAYAYRTSNLKARERGDVAVEMDVVGRKMSSAQEDDQW